MPLGKGYLLQHPGPDLKGQYVAQSPMEYCGLYTNLCHMIPDKVTSFFWTGSSFVTFPSVLFRSSWNSLLNKQFLISSSQILQERNAVVNCISLFSSLWYAWGVPSTVWFSRNPIHKEKKEREREKIKPLAVLMKYHVSHNYTSWGKVRVWNGANRLSTPTHTLLIYNQRGRRPDGCVLTMICSSDLCT